MQEDLKKKDDIELKNVVGSILLAVQEANHLADLEAARLMSVYKKEKSLSSFAVPAFAIAETEIELRFTVVGYSEEKPKSGSLSGLKVKMTAASLQGLEPSQIQLMKLKIISIPLRVFEEDKGK